MFTGFFYTFAIGFYSLKNKSPLKRYRAMLIKLYENNPNPVEVRRIAGILRNGGIIILPTDTVYAFACDIFNAAGVEFIARLKNHDLRRSNLSFICHQLSEVSEYAKMDDASFKLIKKNLLSCKDTREEKEFHPKYFSIYRKSSESIQKVRSRRNHLSEDDSKAA
mgnify:CR=1 FL=1